jgi:hypothetical protein
MAAAFDAVESKLRKGGSVLAAGACIAFASLALWVEGALEFCGFPEVVVATRITAGTCSAVYFAAPALPLAVGSCTALAEICALLATGDEE